MLKIQENSQIVINTNHTLYVRVEHEGCIRKKSSLTYNKNTNLKYFYKDWHSHLIKLSIIIHEKKNMLGKKKQHILFKPTYI
jgi:hypothetical protein